MWLGSALHSRRFDGVAEGVRRLLTGHNIGLVLLGLACWVLVYCQLSIVGSRALGDMVTLILAAIPMLIAVVGLWETGVKAFEKDWLEVSVFALVAVVAGAFWYFAYWRKKEYRKLLEDRGFHTKGPAETLKKLGLLIAGAILILGVVGVGIFGGWQLIQGSLFWGGVSAGIGLVFGVLCHKPEAEWNPFKKWYSALVEGNSEGADEQQPEAAAT